MDLELLLGGTVDDEMTRILREAPDEDAAQAKILAYLETRQLGGTGVAPAGARGSDAMEHLIYHDGMDDDTPLIETIGDGGTAARRIEAGADAARGVLVRDEGTGPRWSAEEVRAAYRRIRSVMTPAQRRVAQMTIDRLLAGEDAVAPELRVTEGRLGLALGYRELAAAMGVAGWSRVHGHVRAILDQLRRELEAPGSVAAEQQELFAIQEVHP